jgi:hypothetical protein
MKKTTKDLRTALAGAVALVGALSVPVAHAQTAVTPTSAAASASGSIPMPALCAAAPMASVLRGTYRLEGEGPLPIELVLAPRDGASARLFDVTGLVSEGAHRFGVSGMAYCTGEDRRTLVFDMTMSGGFHDAPVDDELRRAWPAGKAPKRASSAGTSVVHAQVSVATMRGWAEAMRTIVLTGQRVMGPRHVSASLAFDSVTPDAGEARHAR